MNIENKEIIKITHIKEFSCYNSNYYKVDGFKNFNIVYEDSEDGNYMSYYRKGIFKSNEMRWLDEWFEAEDIESMTKKEDWLNLEVEKEFLGT